MTYAQLSCDKQQAAVVSLNVTNSNSVSISVRFLFSLQSEHVFVSGVFFFFNFIPNAFAHTDKQVVVKMIHEGIYIK